jgi:hypothetical protein
LGRWGEKLMALTTNKKNKIIAEWKAGIFSSHNAVAVSYKIDPKTVKKILDGISQSNTDIVEIGATYENAKKSIKNPNEIKAIEKAISERTIKDDIRDAGLEATLSNIRSVKKKLELEQVETMQDHRHAQETIDKALISSGNADRHAPKSEVNVSTMTAVQNNTTIEMTKEEMITEAKRRGIPLDFINVPS